MVSGQANIHICAVPYVLEMMQSSIAVIDIVQTYAQMLTNDCTESQPCNLIILRANESASTQY